MKFSPLQSPAFMGLCLLCALAFGAATGNRSEDFPTSDLVSQSDLMPRDGGWEIVDVSLLPEAITGLPPAGDGAAPDAPDPATTKRGRLLATFVAGGGLLVTALVLRKRNLK